MTEGTSRKSHEVIVVGGGQAGLALGYHLAKQGRDFTILEAASEPAAAWRERWDSLKLFTSARYDATDNGGGCSQTRISSMPTS